MTTLQHALGRWAAILGGVALGAAAMYVLDPDKGRRRRAIARDKARSLAGRARDRMGVSARDFMHRMRGFRARSRQRMTHDETSDDLVLIERLRARMGRVVSHPHAIQIGASEGRVTLSGPILAAEVRPLHRAVRSVRGVTSIDDHLVAHERPDSIPSLQGGRDRADWMRELPPGGWIVLFGAASLVCGTLATLYRLRER